jgi:hypothetical protein
MKNRTLLLLLFLVVIGAFTILNWSAFTAPTTLSLGITYVQVPLGLVMLALLTLLAASFLVYLVYLQTTVLLETRRHAQEMRANRKLADEAEASRFTELRGFLETERKRQDSLDAESKAAMLTRLEQLDHNLRSTVEQSTNTLSAYIGELEDRLERGPYGSKSLPAG